MEVHQELNCSYQDHESSSHLWPPLNSFLSFSIPQNSDNSNQNENPNYYSSGSEQQVTQKRKRKSNEKECLEQETWNKGHWTNSEDRKLIGLVLSYGYRRWAEIAEHMDGRNGKQCRERWHNNLHPNLQKSTSWSDEEEMMIIEGHKRYGNRWSRIARFLPGRSENAVKNHWNSIVRRQFSLKKISKPKRLMHIYQSPILEDYIKHKLLAAAVPTADDAAPQSYNALFPDFSTAATYPATVVGNSPPPPFSTFNENNGRVAMFSTAAGAFSTAASTPPLQITTFNQHNGPVSIFSNAVPVAAAGSPPTASAVAAATFTSSPITNAQIPAFSTAAVNTPPQFTGSHNALAATFSTATVNTPLPFTTFNQHNGPVEIFSTAVPVAAGGLPPTATATTFAPSPITAVTGNYKALIPAFSSAANFTQPQFTGNHNALTATAAATFTSPPITENYNALIPFSSIATTFPPTAAANTPPSPITTIIQNNGPVAIFSSVVPIVASGSPPTATAAAATNFTPTPITTLTENYRALIPAFSTAANFTQPQFAGNHNALTATAAAAATFTPPRITENYNAQIQVPSIAAANTIPPPITTFNKNNDQVTIFSTASPITTENYSALIPAFSTAANFTPPQFTGNHNGLTATFSTAASAATATFTPPPITENHNALIQVPSIAASTPPPITTITENHNTLIPSFSTAANAFFPPPPFTELPLSVDDYEIDDAMPYFSFDSSVNEENLDHQLMQSMQCDDYYDNDEGIIGNHYPSPSSGDAASTSYFATETMAEEMSFMRSLFDNNGDAF